MSGIETAAPVSIPVVCALEKELVAALAATAAEVARLEDLDQEQRAEVYSILQAVQADTEVHAKQLAEMAQYHSESGANA